jgi:hypothetical protein
VTLKSNLGIELRQVKKNWRSAATPAAPAFHFRPGWFPMVPIILRL